MVVRRTSLDGVQPEEANVSVFDSCDSVLNYFTQTHSYITQFSRTLATMTAYTNVQGALLWLHEDKFLSEEFVEDTVIDSLTVAHRVLEKRAAGDGNVPLSSLGDLDRLTGQLDMIGYEINRLLDSEENMTVRLNRLYLVALALACVLKICGYDLVFCTCGKLPTWRDESITEYKSRGLM